MDGTSDGKVSCLFTQKQRVHRNKGEYPPAIPAIGPDRHLIDFHDRRAMPLSTTSLFIRDYPSTFADSQALPL